MQSSSSITPSFDLDHFNNGSGVIELDIINFSSLGMDDPVNSPKFVIQDMYFWIHASKVCKGVKKSHNRGRPKKMKFLSFWLMAEPRLIRTGEGEQDEDWMCSACCDFQLVPRNGDTDCILSWKSSELFRRGEESCGHEEFEEVECLTKTWKEMYTPDDILHLRVHMTHVTSFRVRDRPSIISGKFIKSEEFNQMDVHHMLGREEGSDFRFVTRDRKTSIPMHSLGPRCPVFRTIFQNLCNAGTRSLKCATFDSEVFKEVLSFLYRFEFYLDPAKVPQYARISRKLRIEPIRILSCRNIPPDSSCLIIMSHCMSDPLPCRDSRDDVYEAALSCLEQETDSVIQHVLQGHLRDTTILTKDLVKRILVNPNLTCREIRVYQLVMYWLSCHLDPTIPDSHDRMRELLDDSIYNIRFTCMTRDEFSGKDGPAGGHLLTPEEKVDIFLRFGDPKVPKFPFSTTPRGNGSFQTSGISC